MQLCPKFVDNKNCQLAIEGQLVSKTSRLITGVIHFSAVLAGLHISSEFGEEEVKIVEYMCRYCDHNYNCCEKITNMPKINKLRVCVNINDLFFS